MKKNIIIIILLLGLVGTSGYIVYDNFLQDENKENEITNTNEKIINDESNENEVQVNKTYKIGDAVTLNDSSTWRVLIDSNEETEVVTLLKDIPLEEQISFITASEYLSTSYLESLKNSMNMKDEDIREIRLLTLEDITRITGLTNLEAGTSLEKNESTITELYWQNDYYWLYQSPTITNKIEYDCPIMICEHDDYETSSARMCIGTGTENVWVRPVIVISKDYIK